jgi:hypothetical protein
VPATAQSALDPSALGEVAEWIAQARMAAGAKEVWLGETAQAQCGGEPGLSDSFASGFYWLKTLGTAARNGVAVVVRQDLVGADYGLLDDQSLAPRPDYWTSWLWKNLMGEIVLDASVPVPGVELYAHCGKRGGVAAAYLNFSTGRVHIGEHARLFAITGADLSDTRFVLNGRAVDTPSLKVDQTDVVLPAQSYGFIEWPDRREPACR